MGTAIEIVSPLAYGDIDRICRTARVLKVAVCCRCGLTIYRDIHLPMVARGWYCAACCPCRTVQLTPGEMTAIDANKAAALKAGAAEAAKRMWSDPAKRARLIAARRAFWAGRRAARAGA